MKNAIFSLIFGVVLFTAAPHVALAALGPNLLENPSVQDIAVEAGATYQFTSHSQSDRDTTIVAELKQADDTTVSQDLGTVAGSGAFENFTSTLTIPDNVTHVTIWQRIHSIGSLNIDTYELRKILPDPEPDTTPPIITLLGTTPVTITAGSVYTDAGATAADDVDGDMTSSLVVVNPVDSNVPGTYIITYNVSDNAGNAASEITRTVVVEAAPEPEPEPQPEPSGLPLNGDFETTQERSPSIPLGWSTDSWGTIRPTFSYPVPGKSGNGAKVETTSSRRGTSGDAKWVFDHIPTTGGKVYKISIDYTANVATNVTAEYKMANGSYQYGWLGSPEASPSSWSTFTGELTIPDGAESFTVFQSLTGAGTLTVDNYSLTEVSGDALYFPQGMITLAFDDGLASFFQNGRPILNAAGIQSTQYIVTGLVGDSDYYMTWDDIAALKNDGNEIAAHTRTHANLTTLSPDAAWNEIKGSYDDLTAQGMTPETFTYPYGEFNSSIVNMVKQAGFIGARSVVEGFNTPSSDKFAILDQHVESNTTVAQVQQWINQALAEKKWLVLELHSQVENGEQYSNDPAVLQGIVDYIQQSGINVVTMSEGVKLMK